MGFANGFGMGPTWVLIWDPHMGPISENIGPLWASIVGPRWVLQMTLA